MVSVIIPTFNRACLLKEAIKSVQEQDFGDFELIVVDDGSTDNTSDVLRSCPDIRVIRQDHRGVSSARNAGIARASGEYLAFLDSDDLWLPEKLSAQAAFFHGHPGSVICQTEEIWIRNGVRVNPGKRHTKHSGMIFEHAVELCIVSPSAVMMRRELLDDVGLFDETLPACEDYDLWLRVACRYPVYLIRTALVIKRGGHKDQVSRVAGLDRFRIYALRKILENPPKGGLTPDQRKAAIAALSKKCTIYAAGCFKRGRVDEARHYMRLKSRFEDEANSSANGSSLAL